MIGAEMIDRMQPWRAWLGGVLCLVVAGAALIVTEGGGCQRGADQPVVHIEEFRVAEPLVTGTEALVRNRLEIITAVTEPYDEVEASVEQAPQTLASSRAELALQCETVLKEVAFCTNEDAYLDIIGRAPNLRESDERSQFMNHVQRWFEPGGSRAACSELIGRSEFRHREAKQIWMSASIATGLVCEDFGQALMEAGFFELMGAKWD